ncbi:ABC-type transporter, integral membrane subunit [Pseudonocardia dioxanivorans CB1190]|uniref:ABC-type transporter, integral membrane subunit n=1 Tax=Pseudonocardia dioxanivorans (strain ATCC 55486 / DSM 44775 / JCM 13855 / CB1190) TaxID=675635 RepID=F4CK23_PSEUX|nr:ABC-type transporter, integral membrane subunit [Pseudonocardia dioxanivorans CB1190]
MVAVTVVEGVAAPATVEAPTGGQPGRTGGGDRFGLIACAVGVLLVLVLLLAPVLAPSDPTSIVGDARGHPSAAHWFGLDALGRDVLSRTLYGGRETLVIALLSTFFAALVGVPLGMLAGYVGRWPGGVTMRVMDVFLAFPGLLLALVIVTIRGPGTTTVVAAVAVSFAPVFARVLYGATQRVRNQEYVAAARVVGCGPARILARHVFPVILPELIVVLSSAIGWTTLLSATLNFLGFGVRPPAPEWGADLAAGLSHISQAWWISTAPGVAVTLVILLANLVGDHLGGRLTRGGGRRRRPARRDTGDAGVPVAEAVAKAKE